MSTYDSPSPYTRFRDHVNLVGVLKTDPVICQVLVGALKLLTAEDWRTCCQAEVPATLEEDEMDSPDDETLGNMIEGQIYEVHTTLQNWRKSRDDSDAAGAEQWLKHIVRRFLPALLLRAVRDAIR
ncbi:hypothetical protein JCM11641_006927 [Rhodosporidiobolus odoratus]